MGKLVDQGGPIIEAAVVQPIFWGDEWNQPTPNQAAHRLVDGLRQLFAGPYMRGLSQYRGISPASVLDPVFDSGSQPPDPVTLDSLDTYVKQLLELSLVPDYRSNDQLLYLILTDGRGFQNANAVGYHYFGTMDDRVFHYAWAMTSSSRITSHEIIEACTDPEATGFLQPENGIEVGDICEETPGANGPSDGILASGYWSNVDSRCIRPRRIARLTIRTPGDNECHVGPEIGGRSTITASLGLEPSWIDESGLPPLTVLGYVWAYDETLGNALPPAAGPSLAVDWIGSSVQPTTVSVTIKTQQGIDVHGAVSVVVHSEAEANLRKWICRLRHTVNRIPPFFVHKLGPDPAPMPTDHEIAEMNAFARSVSQAAEKISELYKTRGR